MSRRPGNCQRCTRYHRLEPLREFRPMPVRDENGFYFPRHGRDYSYIMAPSSAPVRVSCDCDHRWAKTYLRRAEDLYHDMLELAIRRPPPPPPPPPPPEIICTCSPSRHCCCGGGHHSSSCCCDESACSNHHHPSSPVLTEVYTTRHLGPRLARFKHSPALAWPAYANDYDWAHDCECCSHKHSPYYCRYCHEESLKSCEREPKRYRIVRANTERGPLKVRISD